MGFCNIPFAQGIGGGRAKATPKWTKIENSSIFYLTFGKRWGIIRYERKKIKSCSLLVRTEFPDKEFRQVRFLGAGLWPVSSSGKTIVL